MVGGTPVGGPDLGYRDVSTQRPRLLATIVVSNILYDVASTVASGTTVAVTATVSSGKLVNPTSRTNAVVGRVFNASAPTPNVNIGQNNQTAGLITITEVTAGSSLAAPARTTCSRSALTSLPRSRHLARRPS